MAASARRRPAPERRHPPASTLQSPPMTAFTPDIALPTATDEVRAPRIQPFHLLVPLAATAALLIALRPVVDPDVYWHVRLGREIVDRHAVDGAGAAWSLVPPAHHWTSPEWAADVVLRGAVSMFGWRGMLVFQVVLAVAFLATLAWAILPGRDARTGAVV